MTLDSLLALPLVTYTVTDDPDLPSPSQISGIPLEDLARMLGAEPSADMIVAICDDKYRANYPRDYIKEHHPLLVLRVNGEPPPGWPKDPESQSDMGPYMISHPKFTPSFKILSHADEAQIPWGVLRLEFRDEKTVFGAIAPPTSRSGDASVQAGYKIAQQYCFHCHNAGQEGGQKAGRSWQVLAAFASSAPDYFSAYVRDPEIKKTPQRKCRRTPAYDDATIGALRDYFATFAPVEKTMTLRMAKTVLVFAVAFFYFVIVFNNVTDYDSDYQFVRHVLMMDTTFPGNHGMWRAINSPASTHRLLSLHHRVGSALHDSLLRGRSEAGRRAGDYSRFV